VIVWDERKREVNLKKHGLDFADAHLVYKSPHKVTSTYVRNNEERKMDVAMVEIRRMVLALVYVDRGADVRAISFRPASRRERKRYEQGRAKQD
jgi:uncharacterized DUF497 family protein